MRDNFIFTIIVSITVVVMRNLLESDYMDYGERNWGITLQAYQEKGCEVAE
jgi:PhoPQ-activated pathogenicity-related protein